MTLKMRAFWRVEKALFFFMTLFPPQTYLLKQPPKKGGDSLCSFFLNKLSERDWDGKVMGKAHLGYRLFFNKWKSPGYEYSRRHAGPHDRGYCWGEQGGIIPCGPLVTTRPFLFKKKKKNYPMHKRNWKHFPHFWAAFRFVTDHDRNKGKGSAGHSLHSRNEGPEHLWCCFVFSFPFNM